MMTLGNNFYGIVFTVSPDGDSDRETSPILDLLLILLK